MALKVQNGYQVFQDNEPLILEPEDWSIREWATLCKLCGLPLGQTERIVLHANKLECFVNLNKEALDSERTFTVTEVCPHCENEIEMRWNTDKMGFKAFCPVCGKQLMLCDECRHTEGHGPCDYDNNTSSCHRNPTASVQDTVEDAMSELTGEEQIVVNDNYFTIRPQIAVSLTRKDIDDIMVAALEGGITYWCSKAEVLEEKRCSEWGHKQIARGGVLILHDTESTDKWELTLEKFLDGVKLFLELGTYVQIDDGKFDICAFDSTDADQIIQLALFGKLVYG